VHQSSNKLEFEFSFKFYSKRLLKLRKLVHGAFCCKQPSQPKTVAAAQQQLDLLTRSTHAKTGSRSHVCAGPQPVSARPARPRARSRLWATQPGPGPSFSSPAWAKRSPVAFESVSTVRSRSTAARGFRPIKNPPEPFSPKL
jgi:hypothetical protein